MDEKVNKIINSHFTEKGFAAQFSALSISFARRVLAILNLWMLNRNQLIEPQ